MMNQVNNDSLEIPLLVVASAFSVEFLTSWVGLFATSSILIYTVTKITQVIRNWDHAKRRRKEEENAEKRAEEKRIEEHEQYLQSKKEHDLRIKLLEKDLAEKERKEQEERERKEAEEKKKEARKRKGKKKDGEES